MMRHEISFQRFLLLISLLEEVKHQFVLQVDNHL